MQANELREFIKKVDKDRKTLKKDHERKARIQEHQEIREACEAIKLKYFSNAMQPHAPNLEFENMMNLSSEQCSIAARSLRGSQPSDRGDYRHSPLKGPGAASHARLASAMRQEGKARDERVKFIDD